ncbi:phosphate-starvation-inducible PsiE family protein [bacterium]|nr:phosphate-starvation-inducible PsiE family protein [bacterium]
MGWSLEAKIAALINFAEKLLLASIALLAMVATGQEILAIVENRNIELADLLLLFIYTEVLGMIGIFFVSKRIPITLPIFIAITAITRLIILQGKDMDMILLLYESGAIFILSLAILAVRFRPKNYYSYQTDD